MMDQILFAGTMCALLIGSYTDIKTREVPDWLNFGLMIFAIGVRGIFSAGELNYTYILEGLIGFLVFVGVGYLIYYSRFWGGGDCKLIMGMGAVFGIPLVLKVPDILYYLIILIVCGSFYGVCWAFGLVFSNAREVKVEFIKTVRRYKWISFLMAGVLVVSCLSWFFSETIFLLLLIGELFLFFSVYLIMLIKIVENKLFLKEIIPYRLTVGDWLSEDVIVDGEKIVGRDTPGIEREEIDTLIDLHKKGKIKTVKIKEGIPFVPAFLISYIIYWFLELNTAFWF